MCVTPIPQAAVYNKMLCLSGWTMTSGAMTTGQITNFMSVDVQHLMYFFQFVHYVYSLPLMVSKKFILSSMVKCFSCSTCSSKMMHPTLCIVPSSVEKVACAFFF